MGDIMTKKTTKNNEQLNSEGEQGVKNDKKTEEFNSEVEGQNTTKDSQNSNSPEIINTIEDDGKDELQEQLSVIKEVRSELANAYKVNKDYENKVEQLSKELESLKKEKSEMVKSNEKLSKQLDVYKTREVEAEKQAYNKRLEKLSSNFKALGQEKTIEELSVLPKNVVSEFESITNVALEHKKEEQLDSVTVPSQSIGTKNTEKKPEPNKKNFSFDGLCSQLTKQQTNSGSDSKRTINM